MGGGNCIGGGDNPEIPGDGGGKTNVMVVGVGEGLTEFAL